MDKSNSYKIIFSSLYDECIAELLKGVNIENVFENVFNKHRYGLTKGDVKVSPVVINFILNSFEFPIMELVSIYKNNLKRIEQNKEKFKIFIVEIARLNYINTMFENELDISQKKLAECEVKND